MSKRPYLGNFELMVMLVLIRLNENAYGIPIAHEIGARGGREVSLGSIYATLERLETKGLVSSKLGESTPERGGRAKKFFCVTAKGVREVRETQRALKWLWQGTPAIGRETGMRNSKPPAVATWLLEHFRSGSRNEYITGDLMEAYQRGCSRGWYWKQVLAAIIVSLCQEVVTHPVLALRAIAVGWAVQYAFGHSVGICLLVPLTRDGSFAFGIAD